MAACAIALAFGALARPAAAQIADDQPGAASRGPGDVHVFLRSGDGRLLTTSWTGSAWNPWTPLDGFLTSGPSVTSRGGRIIDVFVRGSAGGLHHRAFTGTAWTGWAPLGGQLTSAPGAAARRGTSNLDVAVRGTDNAIHFRTHDGTRWQPFASIGGEARSAPALVSPLPGRVNVFVRGPGDALWHRAWDGRAWREWESLGGQLSSSPAAVSQDSGLLDVFARGTDGSIHQRTWNGSWGPWRRIAGEVSSGPAAAAEGLGKITLFARRGAEVVANVYDHGRGPENGWSGWRPVQAPVGPPAPAPAPEPEPGPGAPPGSAPQCSGTTGPQVSIERRPRRPVGFRSRPRLGGSVRNPDGSPVAGAEVRILDARRRGRELARGRTSRTGRFRIRVPRGPTRTVQAATPAANPPGTLMCSGRVRVRVRAGVTLRVPRRVRGRRIAFRGRLRAGPIPRRGLLVQLEAFDAGRWRQFRSVRTNRRGRFATAYRLQRTTRPRSFRFRARVRAQERYPYVLGTSRTARVRVIP